MRISRNDHSPATLLNSKPKEGFFSCLHITLLALEDWLKEQVIGLGIGKVPGLIPM